MKKSVILSFLCMLCGVMVFAKDVPMSRLEIPTARNAGMGGSHVAYTDNVFSLLVNPAAMMRVEQRSFFALSGSLFNPPTTVGLIDAMKTMVQNSDVSGLADAADILGKQNGKISLGFDFREFPLSIAWVADGFGFGLWNRVYFNPNFIGTYFNFSTFVDVMAPVGFAFKIIDVEGHSLDAGITIKPFVRAMAGVKIDLLDMIQDDTNFSDSLTTPVIAGGGFDLGLLYRGDTGFSAGLTFDDIVTRGGVVANFYNTDNNVYYVPFSMNVGLAYDFNIGRFWRDVPEILAKSGVVFAIDWRDLTSLFVQTDYTQRNAVLNMGLGLQFYLSEILKLRLGLNEMLPAVGIGIDWGPLEFDVAYYGKELGLEPGLLSTSALDITIAIRPNAKKREWPWTRTSLADLISKK